MKSPVPYDLAPLFAILAIGALLAAVPFCIAWRRGRADGQAGRLRALTVLTLFLSFDLVLFGAFTRLTDSGLGCPDWPGCYASASPVGAHADISAAQAAMPGGPVTHGKAWIEMIHRYLATGVGALATLLVVLNWIAARKKRSPVSPWWATATWVWICVQGAFGALTVTMKLYPLIVTGHLLGGLGLLALLSIQKERYANLPLPLPAHMRRLIVVVAILAFVQICLGGWVSTNYAVAACNDFPSCQGSFWPPMDFSQAFTLLRELGAGRDGGYLPFSALTAIHYVHRLAAYVVLAAMILLAWRLKASGDPGQRPWSNAFIAIALWQFASGLGNVLFGAPLLFAVAHTGGSAALVVVLASLLSRAKTQSTYNLQGRGAPRLRPAP